MSDNTPQTIGQIIDDLLAPFIEAIAKLETSLEDELNQKKQIEEEIEKTQKKITFGRQKMTQAIQLAAEKDSRLTVLLQMSDTPISTPTTEPLNIEIPPPSQDAPQELPIEESQEMTEMESEVLTPQEVSQLTQDNDEESATQASLEQADPSNIQENLESLLTEPPSNSDSDEAIDDTPSP